MAKKTLYIAYGSNINLGQMAYRCPTAERVSTGFVENYELEFRRVATIVPKQDSKVPVLVWELRGFAYVDIYKDGAWGIGTPKLAKLTHWMPIPEPPKEVSK